MLVNQRRMVCTSEKYRNLRSKKSAKLKQLLVLRSHGEGEQRQKCCHVISTCYFFLHIASNVKGLAWTWLHKAKILWAFNKFIVLLFSISFELYSVRNIVTIHPSGWWILLWHIRLWASHSLFCHHHICSTILPVFSQAKFIQEAKMHYWHPELHCMTPAV